MNSVQYGLGSENLKNINLSSLAGSFIAPGSPFASSFIGNGFKYNFQDGYTGVGSNASGAYIGVNILLGYAGNTIGQYHGNTLGNMWGNGTQTVFDLYRNINKK